MDTLEIKESPAYFKEETSLRKKIEQVLKPYQPLLWGVCDPPPDLKNPGIYEKVLIVAVPFLWPLKLTEYKEPIFKHLQSASFERYGKISKALQDMLRAENIRFGLHVESDAEDFERLMFEDFSTKEAMRRAGLGWIGRSNLLITEEYGPQVNMIAIFLDAPLTSGTPIEESRCGNCRNCVDNCPFQVIHGRLWEPGITREEQVDFKRCSLTRLKTYEHLGRKITCAKCVIACPHGWKWPNKKTDL